MEELLGWIAEGEHQRQDFKFAVNDSRKIAIALSAFANTEGGRLLVGVKDNGRVAGVRSDEELYMVEAAAEMYCSPIPEVYYQVLEADEREVLVVEVMPSKNRPIRAIDSDGKPLAYIRERDRNYLASPVHLEWWKRADEIVDRSHFGAAEKELIDLVGTEPNWRLNDLVRASKRNRKQVLYMLGDLLHWNLIELVRSETEFLIRLRKSEPGARDIRRP